MGLSCSDSGQPPLAAGQVYGTAVVSTFWGLMALSGVSHMALNRPDLHLYPPVKQRRVEKVACQFCCHRDVFLRVFTFPPIILRVPALGLSMTLITQVKKQGVQCPVWGFRHQGVQARQFWCQTQDLLRLRLS